MRLIIVYVLLLIITPNFLFAQQKVTKYLYFKTGNYILTDSVKCTIDKCLEDLNNQVLKKIEISGYTLNGDNDEYNYQISNNRLKEVQQYLILKNINTQNIKMVLYGITIPIKQNNDSIGNELYSRIEIEFEFAIEEIAEKEILEVADSTINYETSKKSQIFIVPNTEIITIKGNEGTRITIPKNTLVRRNGQPVNASIEIELKEFYKKSDFILSNLNTMSDKGLLESGGMLYISAKYKSELLQLKSGSEIQIEFATQKAKNMEIFTGEIKNNQIIWKQEQRNKLFFTIVYGSTSRIIVLNNDSTYSKTIGKIDNMILTTGKLGWINCDRFYDYKNKTNLIVNVDTTLKPSIRLVFKDINSVMSGYFTKENKIVLENIPVGKKATLISFSMINDVPYYSSKEITIRKDQVENLEMVKTTLTELETELAKLN